MSHVANPNSLDRGAGAPVGMPISLDPSDWTGFRVEAHRMLDDMIDYIANIRERAVWQPIPDPLRAQLRGDVPLLPTDLAMVHAEFMQNILPFAAGNVHPGFMGWVHGGGTPVGMVAEMLAAGLNANLGGRDHAPVEVERQVVNWVRELFGFPQGATGLFVTGTSMANFISVVVARDVELGFQVRQQGIAADGSKRLTAYGSAAVHGCLAKALDLAGLGSDALRIISTSDRHCIDVEALEQAIREDRRDGFTPFIVVGSAGTVDTGAIDDLTALANLCQREKLWFHVDGAYGALAILAPDLASRLKGIEYADSLAFDFHKWGQVPYDSGFVLIRNGQLHRRSFEFSPAYLKREIRGLAAGAPWPCDFGPDLSRGFHALKVWFTLKVHGTEAIGAVISQTCELARYLEALVADSSELELLAPVELNIVCFRYRAEDSDRINEQIVVELQECGSVAPSTTRLNGRVAIRVAIVNHRTSRVEIRTLVDETLALGRALAGNSVSRQSTDGTPENGSLTNMQLALRSVETQLQLKPDSTTLLFQRACFLEQTGRLQEARGVYLDLLAREPSHLDALKCLGNLLLASRETSEARRLYELAIEYHPDHPPCRANLGNLMIKGGEHEAARDQFEHALRVDPNYRPAHAGLSFVLGHLGDPERATWHRSKAFQDRCVVVTPYRGTKSPIIVLELVSTTGGNIRTDDYLSDRAFQRILVTTEFYDPNTVLPPHHLVVNAIGEADGASAALTGALSVLAHTEAPVINPPAAVLATGRCEIMQRLSHIPNLITARTLTLSREQLLASDAAATLALHGFSFPLLLRSPGFHGGEHFLRVEVLEDLAAAVNELPGDDLFVIQYLDARGADGNSRKYRVMMVDGKLYPLHVAISGNWKIHYYSADMADCPEHRAEDAAFLADMDGVLGQRAVAALQQIQRTLGLDYGGIDFGLTERGEVQLFEANATMAVIVPDKDQRWDYRRSAVEKIYRAVWTMLRDRAIKGPPSSK
ncbi:pyridoxal-dependent decarboxylase [Tunturiibacter lichenicola]|uniref:pyridoxal-dependent decarboxylase n=1 Tax=Tunturiibacter lichenicola TaxID=2051959 RepID=UPI003D9AFE40